MANCPTLCVGDWELKGHLLEDSRLLVLVEAHQSCWINIVIEQTGCQKRWMTLFFDWFLRRTQQPTSDARASEMLLLAVLGSCHERYKHELPEFGNNLCLTNVDDDGHPTIIEEADPAIVEVLPTADVLFGKKEIPLHIIPKSKLRVQAINGTFFLPQTRPVLYDGETFVAKGPASATRVLDDLREAVSLVSLQMANTHPHILPPPVALVGLSDDDKRICGFLIPFYKNGNLGSYARQLRGVGELTPFILQAWFRQLVSATKFLVDAGTWHGDIKPDNIVVESSGAIILIDLAGKYTTTSIASPERGSLEVPVDWPLASIEKSEVYSIGRTMYFVSEGIAMETIYNNPETPQASQTSFSDATSTPAQLKDLILSCVNEDPTQRPSLSDLASRLTGRLTGHIVP
ncbi:unnamed protein product [Clonostachys rhizophaga]|uniref:Protein kinase domain-containing protein n=1 Tax=Clonostachys rhizophaga TaxID=160324 RepID=A0A9N9YMW5_9HYPO|nr:unnamed protein product [Clonostachys rhizophaga]